MILEKKKLLQQYRDIEKEIRRKSVCPNPARKKRPKDEPEQADLFTNMHRLDRLDRLDNCVEEVRCRFGKKAVYPAVLMGDFKMPNDGRDLVRMPGLMAR